MKTLITLAVLVFGIHAQAGDSSHFESLGFSSSGKYYSYIQEGEYDGLGAYYVEMGIIDVVANKYIGRKKLGGELSNGDITTFEDREKMIAELKIQLRFDNYFPSEPTQETVLKRLDTDFSEYEDTRFSSWYQPLGGAHVSPQTYKLHLKEVQAPIHDGNDWCWEGIPNNMIELKMEKEDVYSLGESEIRNLQIDTKQPDVRACSYDYRVIEVNIHNEKSLAVTLRFARPGFEGPDERVMVVTGQLF